MNRQPVVIIGGGWAGLSAATRLVENGHPVTLFERSNSPGGRASSFYEKELGEWLDNGPHIVIGAYTAARRLLQVWGSAAGISYAEGDAIPWLYPNGKIIRLQLGGSSGKFGALTSLLSFGGMPVSDRLKTIRALDALVRWADVDLTEETTVADFLARYNIKPGDCGGLWDALTTAVMNGPPYLVGLHPIIKAIKEGLLVGGDSGRIGIPTRPFKNLYVDPALEYLTGQGVEMRLDSSIDAIQTSRQGALSEVISGDSVFRVKRVISAVPPFELLRLLPEPVKEQPFFSRFTEFEYAPIVAVHLSFDAPVLPVRFGYIPDSFTQWIFARGIHESEGWSQLSAVISYAPRKDETSSTIIGAQVLDDVRRVLPPARRVEVKYLKVVRTVRATVLLKPGSESLRPPPETPVKGLYLAGDWCGTGLPATIESAARSGDAAARAAMRDDAPEE
jgi:squalene-associated FAD-dependent desaturase